MKLVDIDGFIEKHGNMSVCETVNALKEEPEVKAIPIEFIREWFKKHYKTEHAALIDDWENQK